MVAAFMITAILPAAARAEENYPSQIKEIPSGEDFSGKTVVLHSNDVHGALDGYAKMAALRNAYQDMGAEVFLVDAGDFMQGSPYVGLSRGADAMTMMNAAGYSLAGIGNHEFDYGIDQLENVLGTASFPVICANVYKDGELLLEPRTILTARSGVKIGFFGLDTPETMTKSNPKNMTSISFLGGAKMAACAQEQTDALLADGADVVIGLTHLGVNAESGLESNRSVDLYHAVKRVDLLIDGHSHTVMTEGPDGEPVQSTGTKFAYVGVVVLDEKGRIEDHYLISAEGLENDPVTEASAAEIEEKIDSEYSAVFAVSEVVFDGTRENNRSGETNNGDLTADSLLWFAGQNADLLNVPVENVVAWDIGGDFRDEIPSGEITKKHILNVHPFGNSVCFVPLSGEELLEALEASTFCTPDLLGGYPQTAGIRFTVDTTKPYDAGELYPESTYYRPRSIQRVTIESIGGKPFDPSASYVVATNDFTASGGDTEYIFGTKDEIDTGILVTDVLIDYIAEELDGVLTEEKYGQPRGDQTILTGSETVTPPESKPEPKESVHIVDYGDSLWKIAEKYYGDGAKWSVIYEANSDKIVNPSLIYPGQKLVIPT